jgi:hypothetical protein
MPTVAFPPAAPFTDQVTVVALSPVTVAVNCWTCPAPTNAVCGEIVTAAAAAGLTVTVAVADFVMSVLLVAITDAVIAFVTLGAVYLPVASTVPGLALLLLTVQVTPAFDESFVIVAVNCAVPPDVTVAVAGETVTEIVFPELGLLLPPQPDMKESNASTNSANRLVENSLRIMASSAAWTYEVGTTRQNWGHCCNTKSVEKLSIYRTNLRILSGSRRYKANKWRTYEVRDTERKCLQLGSSCNQAAVKRNGSPLVMTMVCS